jgi:hypothetical protein
MKNLPIDTSGMSLLCAATPVAVVDFKSKLPKVDEHGAPLFTVELVALHDGGAEIMPVRLAGLPSESLVQGTPVRVSGLVATHWEMGDWSGVAFRADRIDPTEPVLPRLFNAGNGSETAASTVK